MAYEIFSWESFHGFFVTPGDNYFCTGIYRSASFFSVDTPIISCVTIEVTGILSLFGAAT